MSIARLMQQAAAGVPTGVVWTDPDLANASYDSVSFSVATEDASPFDCFFKPDGTKMYVVGQGNDALYQYTLSTAWDLSSASYDSVSFSLSTQDTATLGLFFKPDGTKFYIVGNTNDTVFEYDLSSAWDISTASYSANSFSVNSQDATPAGVFFREDGLRMYVVGLASDSVYQYTLSSAWDVSTASYDSKSLSVTTQDTNPSGLFFNPDGTKVWVSGTVGDAIYQYTLSTAWDISTATYDSVSFDVSAQDGGPRGFFFKPDGSKMYLVGSVNDTIYQYSTVAPAAPSWTDPDLANASYDSVSFSAATEDTLPRNIFFKPDGLSLFMVGDNGADVNEYTLSAAWDIATASYTQNFSVSTQGGSPHGLFFKGDGSRMYISDYGNDSVYEYSLSSAWDISTASYVQALDVSTYETGPAGLFFKSDGTKMYHVGFLGDEVNEYSLSTAWDISSASHVQAFDVSSQDTGPIALYFNPNGDKMWIAGNGSNSVYEYSLSTAWDVSSASYGSISFSVAGQVSSGTSSLFFKSDGSKMFVGGTTTDTIYQYSTD